MKNIKMRYSIEPRDVKGYGFLSFAKNLSNKYGQNPLDSAKKSTADAIKTALKRAIQKTAEATGDLVGNKIADRITKVSKTLPQNNSDKITNEHEKYILKERYVSLGERDEIIDELRLI